VKLLRGFVAALIFFLVGETLFFLFRNGAFAMSVGLLAAAVAVFWLDQNEL
jgi:riboflavin transporter FmnP